MSIDSESLSNKVANTRSVRCDIKAVLSEDAQSILSATEITCVSHFWKQGPNTLKMRICSNKNIISMVSVPKLELLTCFHHFVSGKMCF